VHNSRQLILMKKTIILFGIAFMVMLFFSSLIHISQDAKTYATLMEKNGVFSTFQEDIANHEAQNIIRYLQGQPLESEFFNAKEKAHMVDVKRLLDTARLLTYLSIIIVVLLAIVWRNESDLAQGLVVGSLLVDIGVLFGLFFLLTFDTAFTLFHQVLFSNTLWLLDPLKDNMILLFPQGFFIDMLVRGIIIVVVFANTVLLTTLTIGKIYKGSNPYVSLKRGL